MRNTNIRRMSADQRMPGGNLFNFQDWDQVTEFLKLQGLQKGFEHTTTSNATSKLPITLGDARCLLGFVVYDPTGDPLNKISLKVNNSIRIDDVSIAFLSRTFGDPATFQSQALPGLYVPVTFPLNGVSDSIELSFNTITRGPVLVSFFYI